ncbi:MAG: spore coat protein U domain-containing protein [Polaromonas sp.]|uniref:Csu type fimbrial protein n=1 Tax=Polaromonas sp. TaxID=1869339 RepID=UPI0024874637|nr:spore coat protein U domain-containing protein [Polaromonas sp.]MDI1238536.1 spore coat protein U domain-containing protein [Polaromonas sp.]
MHNKTTRIHRLGLAALCVFASLAPGLPTLAATAPSNIAVSATVQATCTTTATSLAFGTYTGAQADATATITVTCTNTTAYSVGLDAGLGTTPAATVTTRHMNGPAAAGLAYTLKSVSQTGSNWGNTPPTDTVAGTGSGSGQPITVYGRVAAGQLVTPGAYADTITATVTY